MLFAPITSDLNSVLESFSPTEILSVEVGEGQKPELPPDAKEDDKKAWELLSGQELRLIPQSDPDQYQTLPILSIPITVQSVDGTPEQQLTIPRTTFTRAVSRVLFARGFEEKREKFMYWKLHADGQVARFVAGTGGVFAIDDLRGASLTDSKQPLDLLIPNEPSDVIAKVFADCAYPTVTIKHFGNRLSFEAENLRVVCVGLNANIQWVDEDLIMKRRNLYQFAIPVAALDLAVKGMVATNNDEAKKRDPVHVVNLSLTRRKNFCRSSVIAAPRRPCAK